MMEYEARSTEETCHDEECGQCGSRAARHRGLALIAFAMGWIGAGSGWNWLGWIGIVPLLTAAIGNCPAYSLLGVSTCPLKG